MLMEIDGVRVLMDPVWEERASPFSWMGPKRFFEAPLRLEELPRIDAVLVSHDHYDHLGKETGGRLGGLGAGRGGGGVTSVGVGKVLRGFGVPENRIAELDWTQSVEVKGEDKGVEVTITAVPARH